MHIFGSRAKGTYSQGSDIDLAIMNDDVSNETVRCIKSACDESSLPYMVDVLHAPSLRNNDVREHIERVGTVFYER
ncbi:MAG: nucleotidyltransferase domain-containing protein [Candidatus Kapabacteria bacterium]|nr:nucleotidyltransferase domain-containing protein [Candidatus Kapabacteria bacterium]